MNWIQYYNDLSTAEKRKVRQQILVDCQLSRRSFYALLGGKQGRLIILSRINTIVEQARQKAPTKERLIEVDCV